MVKSAPVDPKPKEAKNSKYNRFEAIDSVDPQKKSTWPTDGVVYIGHIPHGFYQDQLKAYFGQYGQVLAVKVARSRKTARSKGYAFVQFKYPQVAKIASETMNGYMLMGKVLVSNVLAPNKKNPFTFATSKDFSFINWKRIFMGQKNKVKTPEQKKKEVAGLLTSESSRRQKLKAQGIDYEFPGYSAYITPGK